MTAPAPAPTPTRDAHGHGATSSKGSGKKAPPTLRQMTHDDLDAVHEMERLAFQGIPEERLWKPEQLLAHVERFPEGQFVAEIDGRIMGSCTNMLTTWERATKPHTWREITGGGRLETHDPAGDVLYGTEVMVHPDARRRGVGRALFNRRYQYVRDHDLRAFVTGGRLPGYAKHADRMTAWNYIERVARDEMTDPVLTPELRWGLTPLDVLCGYMIDPPSLHHATLVVWENPERAGRT